VNTSTRIYQDTLVDINTYQVDQVNNLHIVLFTFDYRIRCNVYVRCMHAYSNIRTIPSMKIVCVIVSVYTRTSRDIQK
jgi:hypothetical protein